MLFSSEDDLSDDEIFFGKLSIKELRKHIMRNNHGQSKRSNFRMKQFVSSPDCNTSIKIIESHSQPNLYSLTVDSPNFFSVPGSPAVNKRKSDKSFIQMKNMVPKMRISPFKAESLELNNTVEVIEYILNKGPNQKIIKSETENEVKTYNMSSEMSPLLSKLSPNEIITPQKDIAITESPKYFTPITSKKQQADVFATPSSNIKTKTHLFKTPANCGSQKKPPVFSLKKAPGKTNAFQFIKSPVASYINNSPSVPLIKNVYPRKPLPGPSSIPKLVKNPPKIKIQNKENINLPSIAYKSAKKTKVTQIPDEEKLPQSQWAKKLVSALPRPTVTKHERRENNVSKSLSLNIQDDSFANLSSVQAEVSICTQKSAYKTKKRL